MLLLFGALRGIGWWKSGFQSLIRGTNATSRSFVLLIESSETFLIKTSCWYARSP